MEREVSVRTDLATNSSEDAESQRTMEREVSVSCLELAGLPKVSKPSQRTMEREVSELPPCRAKR